MPQGQAQGVSNDSGELPNASRGGARTVQIDESTQILTAEVDADKKSHQKIHFIGHGFELGLVVLIACVSFLLVVPIEKVCMHVFESVATIALVHCVGTLRTIGERLSQFREFQSLAICLSGVDSGRKIEISKKFHSIASRVEGHRAWFQLYTFVTACLWVLVSISYSLYISPMAFGQSHATLEQLLKEKNHDEQQEVSSDASDAETNARKSHPVTITTSASEGNIPAYLLRICAGLGAGIGLGISMLKVWVVSHPAEEATVGFFLNELNMLQTDIYNSTEAEGKLTLPLISEALELQKQGSSVARASVDSVSPVSRS